MTHDTHAAPGRPQDEELTGKILDETLRVLQVSGYSSLRIEQVAAAVGCSKTTIYRRWSTRAELTADALRKHSVLGDTPDTGSVVEDLVEHAWRNAENQQPTRNVTDVRHTLWAAIVEPDVRVHFWDNYLSIRRTMGLTVISRAVDKGELPAGTDGDAILDLLAGLTLYRGSVRGVPINKADYRPIITALVASPPLKPAEAPSP